MVYGFVPTRTFSKGLARFDSSERMQLAGSDTVDISEFPEPVVYTITSRPPLGVILAEFRSETVPFLSPTVVDDIIEGQNGAKAGVREGDVLIALGDVSMLSRGIGFNEIVENLESEFAANGEVQATFYRGSAFGRTDGFNQIVDAIVNGDNLGEAVENAEDVGGEVGGLFIDDLGLEEDYDKISVSKLFSSFVSETASAIKTGLSDSPKETERKKKGGFLGMFSQETIQMEDNPNMFANKVDENTERD
eukprot:CAMPEP_0113314340 /NCGR_PEP_ID=MMETSP0010_2-20120614/10438_1 /TAXON_ID=216773 ORGANISM="Corethron hystrix, Strain 308" /NCGR_SAMPLE_ID=MMETSP0010_2 /ASSEMBLY_ACC=CAM_ASM_000155 /LENGTH=248 /DNA_ID=CAMNT_0000170603 /DNA_START=71 /DNA_END=817 /DNA_ORIENTATION=+ /assembly_acc=CAM_ASM_000155